MTVHHGSGLFRATPDRTELRRAAALLGATAPSVTHTFEPHGESLAVLGSRRVVLHTWPEHGLVTVDVYADAPVDLTPLIAHLGWSKVAEPGDDGPSGPTGDAA
ncbi:MAG: S-adenosylmethionine decarboxylase [Myxococcota bacterium]